MKKMTLIIGTGFMALAVFCSWMQATYYGYVDAEGVLHDSLYLPLTFIFGFLGVLFLVTSFGVTLFALARRRIA